MTDTPEMIERVARVIYNPTNDPTAQAWEHLSDERRADRLMRARAAIEAMAEPTQEMRRAANVVWSNGAGVSEIYTTAIRTALTPTKDTAE